MSMRVFISSTFEDLMDYRLAAGRAIQELGMVSLDVVERQTRPQDLIQTSLLALHSADVFVGIYASYYGEPLPPERLSLPEQVYLKARQQGLPCYLYLVDPREAWPMDYLPTGFRGAMMRMFLDRLKGHEGLLRYFSNPDDLAEKVIFDLARFKLEAPRKKVYNMPSLDW